MANTHVHTCGYMHIQIHKLQTTHTHTCTHRHTTQHTHKHTHIHIYTQINTGCKLLMFTNVKTVSFVMVIFAMVILYHHSK